MLLLSETLLNKPILSLRTGSQIAVVNNYLINPNNFKIEGFYCYDKSIKQSLILLYQDIRNIIDQGIIVNDHDVLSSPDILIRHKDLIEINFVLIGKPVVTISKEKIGRVKDFAVDSETFYVQKLYVSRAILKSFSSGQLSVDRGQIIEVTDTKIIIADLQSTAKLAVPKTRASFSSSTQSN